MGSMHFQSEWAEGNLFSFSMGSMLFQSEWAEGPRHWNVIEPIKKAKA